MAKQNDPLVIPYFSSGLYTHRSQLFSPSRSVGVNVVSYHDAVIDGQDMELTTLMQWTRRPGFSRFCSQQLGVTEVPLQFYSVRQPAGTVVPMMDSNIRWTQFSPSAITNIMSKSTTAQGYIQQIGGLTYYANGVDLVKWDGVNFPPRWGIASPANAPAVSQTLGHVAFWEPNYTYPNYGIDNQTIVDPNGNFQQPPFANGTTGASPPIWNTVYGGLTQDNLTSWLNRGPFQSWAPSTPYQRFQIVVDSNGNLQQLTTVAGGTSGTAVPTWATTENSNTTDGGLTWKAIGSVTNHGDALTTSGQATIQAGYIWAYAYRSIWGHLSTLSPLTAITGPGIGVFSVDLSGVSTGDSQCTQGFTVSNPSITSNVLTLTTSGTIRNLVAGQNYTLSAFGTATYLNGKIITILTVVGPLITAAFIHANASSADAGAQASFNGIEVYRNADGGGLLYYLTSLPNGGGAGVPWAVTDNFPDASLNTAFIGPLNHLNDPPPGTSGSLVTQGGTLLAYWQGRIWMAVGNKLYFNAGPDCINGVPEESWPPANVFQYSGPITGLTRTSQGLLVWGSDYVAMALGGPQTLSFYPWDLMQNFGISSPNCIDQDGDTISILSTAGQCWLIDMSGKSETGNWVTEVINATFAPNTSYITYHRQGQDSAMWLSDGSVNALRFGLNIQAWSTEYKPVGGIKALNSVETSTGVMTLCAGRPTGGGYILGRNQNTQQDDGLNYTNCFVTVGSIILSQPGAQLVPLQHVVLYCDAAGTGVSGPTVPTVAILPNEVAASAPASFITLSSPVSEYTTANNQSSSLLSLRWPVDSMNSLLSSQLMHHVQVKITFPPENAPNSIKAMALMFTKDA